MAPTTTMLKSQKWRRMKGFLSPVLLLFIVFFFFLSFKQANKEATNHIRSVIIVENKKLTNTELMMVAVEEPASTTDSSSTLIVPLYEQQDHSNITSTTAQSSHDDNHEEEHKYESLSSTIKVPAQPQPPVYNATPASQCSIQNTSSPHPPHYCNDAPDLGHNGNNMDWGVSSDNKAEDVDDCKTLWFSGFYEGGDQFCSKDKLKFTDNTAYSVALKSAMHYAQDTLQPITMLG